MLLSDGGRSCSLRLHCVLRSSFYLKIEFDAPPTGYMRSSHKALLPMSLTDSSSGWQASTSKDTCQQYEFQSAGEAVHLWP